MLPSLWRLPLKTELKRLKKNGQIFQGKFFGLLLAKQEDQKQNPRFAMIVSNKVAKKAVDRNQIRRWVSEALRSFLPQIKNPMDGVFLVKKTALGTDYQQIKKEIELLFKKAGLF